MNIEGKLPELLRLVRKNWHEPFGFSVGVILSLILVQFLLDGMAQSIGYGAAVVLLFVIWHFSRALPKASPGKLGFVVCIACEKDEEARVLRADFIETLHSLVESGEGGKQIEMIFVPNHLARGVQDEEDATRIRERSRASFLLYGRARKREIGGKIVWLLNLDGMVKHAAIPEQMGRRFAQEFRELLPPKVEISNESDVLGFEFTSKLVDVVARYIMGVAAGLSGRLEYAECLFRETELRLPAKSPTPIHERIRKRLPWHFGAIHLAYAADIYERWLQSHQPEDLAGFCQHLSLVPTSERSGGDYTLKQALCLFIKDRNAQGALAVLRDNPYGEDPGWHFSMAFVQAWCGHLRRAIQHYKALRTTNLSVQVVRQVEEFLFWLEQDAPENWSVNYCLGYINWWIKGDTHSAATEFAKFLDKLPAHERTNERRRIERIVRVLDSQE